MTRSLGSTVAELLDRGPEDPLYRGLLFTGPLLVAMIAVIGRSTLTLGLAVGYLAGLVGAILYNAAR